MKDAVAMQRAIQALQAGDYRDALGLCDQGIQNDPQNPSWWMLRGNISHHAGDLGEAETAYRKATELKPDFVEALVNLGAVLAARSRVKDAKNYYMQAISLRPYALRAHIGLGSLFGREGDFQNACRHYQAALQSDSSSVEANTGLATCLQAMGRYHDATSIYRTILAIDPANAQARHMLAALEQGETPATANAQYVAALFDGYAEGFDEHLTRNLEYKVPELLNSALRGLLVDGVGKMSVLDLGCGTGLCGELLTDISSELVGIDLSVRMLDQARAKNVYSELVATSITEYLSGCAKKFDLIVAADVFVYIGDLFDVFSLCRSALEPGGLFAFSIEIAVNAKQYELRETGRYAHSLDYIVDLANAAGYSVVYSEAILNRKENNKPVAGRLVILRNRV